MVRHAITRSRFRIPRFNRSFTWDELTAIAKQRFPEFHLVLPLDEYSKTLKFTYALGGVPFPKRLEVKELRKVALGNCWFPAPNTHFYIGVEKRLNNTSRVWSFFHEMGHLLNNHTMPSEGKWAVSQMKKHEAVANRFAYEEILDKGLVTGKTYNEIPGSSYSEQQDNMLYITNPSGGSYTLTTKSDISGKYSFEVYTSNGNNPAVPQIISATIKPNTYITFIQNYDPTQLGSSSTVDAKIN